MPANMPLLWFLRLTRSCKKFLPWGNQIRYVIMTNGYRCRQTSLFSVGIYVFRNGESPLMLINLADLFFIRKINFALPSWI